jgi:hypothetical protein
MRISLKLILGLWVGLFLIIGALLFTAYSRLKPETFIALLTQQVQKNYPGSKLTVAKVSYRFSLDFNLNLQDIHLRRNDRLLASIGEVELKVPWWLLLVSNGNVQVNMKDLDIYVDQGHADRAPAPAPLAAAKPIGDAVRVTLPEYLVDAKFTLRAKQISVRDMHNSRRYFNVSKLLVREFQYGKNSAFELNIPITIRHKDAQYASDLWLFGDVTPETSRWILNYRGEFRTKEASDRFQIEDLVIGGRAAFIPGTLEVSSDIELTIDKAPAGKGEFRADQESLSVALDLTRFPLTYFSFIYDEIKNPYLVNPAGEASGAVKFRRSFDTRAASVTGKLSFPGTLFLTEKDSIPGKWQLSFQDSRWEISFMSPKGEASFFRRLVVDLNRGTVSQYIEELGFSGLDLGITIAPVAAVAAFAGAPANVYHTTTISYKKCLLGDQVLDGQFRYGHTPEKRFYVAELAAAAGGSLKLSYGQEGPHHAVDVTLDRFRWTPSFRFLHPIFVAESGILTGKVEGRWDGNWETGKWLVQVTGKELRGPEGQVPDFIGRTGAFFELDSKAFNKQNLSISGKNGVLSLGALTLESAEQVKITGTLSSRQKSFLSLTYPRNRKVRPVRKEVLEPYWKLKEAL